MSINEIRDGDGDKLSIDVSGAAQMITRLHYETHNGRAYEVGNIWSAGAYANLTNFDLLVRVQPNEQIHMAITAQVEARATVTMIDGVTPSAIGTPLTPRNLNRHFSDSSAHLWYFDPTHSGGTELTKQLIPAGDHNKGGGLSGVFVEHNFVPRNNVQTDYIIRTTNISGGTVDYVAMYILYYAVPYPPTPRY